QRHGQSTQPTEQLSRRAQKKARKAEKKAAKKSKPKSRKRKVAKVLGIVFLVLVLALGARFYKDIARLTGNNNPLSLLGVFKPVDLKNDNGRVNILVAGNSADDLGHGGAELTDSIMVLSINTKNNTALMLSIPRDLWVDIPDYGHAKINAAYPNGGMDSLKTVVEEVTDLPIHYTALVNYTAFRDLVNAVGGITITIDSDDPRGIYDPSLDWTTRNCCALAKYPNGPVELNGKQALNLARARGDAYGSYGYPDSDYTRTKHQRQMLVAIKDKASSTSVIANPLKVGSLLDALGANVRTDLQLNEMQALYYYGKKVDDSKIDSYSLRDLKGDSELMIQGSTIDGQSVQIPTAGVDNYTDIQEQIQKIFTAGPLYKENAIVVILNATDGVGLASQQASKLSKEGVNVAAKGDASANQATTTVIDNSQGKKPNTLAYIKKTYNATVVTDNTLTANYPAADFILILGQNTLDSVKQASSQ
ncbi:LCP family protein, partial [Candidatus Saccharibacteria bacterium]|nr:LCP family protein [Candidatus Saccharibacteria bacterium]